MAKGVTHIAITVKDMDISLKFYLEALGLEKAFDLPNPKDGTPWIEYLCVAKGQFIELFYGGKETAEWKDGQIGFNHLSFEVEDIYEATEQVRKSGFPVTSEPSQGVDHNWQSWTVDPNGIRIELMQITKDSPHFKFM
jgi:lactoylglutathione lyase